MRLDRSRPGPFWLARVWRGLAVVPTVAALLCAPAQARGIDDAGAHLARRLLSEGKILPLEDIIGRARNLRDGSLIDAELSFEDDHAAYVYELHMLDAAGAVWQLEFNADTSELIEHKPIDH